MPEKLYITAAGKKKMEDEIARLKFTERPKVVRELEEARSHGDLAENAEYHAAKERLGHIDGKVAELEDKIARSEVVDLSKINNSRVVFGTRVKLVNLNTLEEITYRIVGDFEADPNNNEISINSPVAKALIGKEVGDEVIVYAPSGKKEFEIIEISI